MRVIEETLAAQEEEMRREWFVKSNDRAKKRSDNDGIIQTNSLPPRRVCPARLFFILSFSWLARDNCKDSTYRNYFCHFSQSWIFYGR